jgi:hypothetical protein
VRSRRRGPSLCHSGDTRARRLAYKQVFSFRENDVLRLTACACGTDYLVQTDKGPWMRLFRRRAHYFCVKCQTRQFVPENLRVSWSLSRTEIEAAMAPDRDRSAPADARAQQR